MQTTMYIVSAFCAALLAAGLWQLARALVLRERSTVGQKAVRGLSEREKRESFDPWRFAGMRRLSAALAERVRLDDLTKERLDKRLRRAELELSAEEYTARRYVLLLLGGVLLALCFWAKAYLWALAAALLTAGLLVRQHEQLEAKLRAISDEIRFEMPKFVRSICQLLAGNRDIEAVLTTYRKTAGGALGKELDVLLLGIQTGGVSSALIQFQNRLGIEEAYRLCAALLDMERGIDQTAALQGLAEDMSQAARLRFKKALARRAGQMRRTFIPAALFCGAFLIYALICYLMQQLQGVW